MRIIWAPGGPGQGALDPVEETAEDSGEEPAPDEDHVQGILMIKKKKKIVFLTAVPPGLGGLNVQ